MSGKNTPSIDIGLTKCYGRTKTCFSEFAPSRTHPCISREKPKIVMHTHVLSPLKSKIRFKTIINWKEIILMTTSDQETCIFSFVLNSKILICISEAKKNQSIENAGMAFVKEADEIGSLKK